MVERPARAVARPAGARLAGLLKRLNLTVRRARRTVISLSDHPPPIHHDGTDHRIRAGVSGPPRGQGKGPSHEAAVILHALMLVAMRAPAERNLGCLVTAVGG